MGVGDNGPARPRPEPEDPEAPARFTNTDHPDYRARFLGRPGQPVAVPGIAAFTREELMLLHGLSMTGGRGLSSLPWSSGVRSLPPDAQAELFRTLVGRGYIVRDPTPPRSSMDEPLYLRLTDRIRVGGQILPIPEVLWPRPLPWRPPWQSAPHAHPLASEPDFRAHWLGKPGEWVQTPAASAFLPAELALLRALSGETERGVAVLATAAGMTPQQATLHLTALRSRGYVMVTLNFSNPEADRYIRLVEAIKTGDVTGPL
jgi:hypothetical protein